MKIEKKNTYRTRSAKEGRQERRRRRRSTKIGGEAEGEQRSSVVCDGDVCDIGEGERADSNVGGVAGGAKPDLFANTKSIGGG
ncbi:hypothetical protein U1Q18_016750 [Sarracenia purpurea var. burkii]